MPYKPLQYLGPLGNQQSGKDFISNWGDPQINLEETNPQPVMRGQLPKWAPGEFEQWKQAHVLGVPTQYGLQRQRLYNSRMIPTMGKVMTNYQNAEGINQLGQQIGNPMRAFELLKQGR